MTTHQNCLVGMHDTSYDTPLLSASQRRCTDHLCVALWVFICLFKKRGEVSNISAARCGHWRRPSWYFNYRKFRWSSDIIKIDVCPWRSLMTPWKKLVKFGTSFDDCAFQTGASHMKDHGFQKEMCQFKLLWPLTSSFGLIKFRRYAITIIPRVWFSGAFQVSLAIFMTFFRLTCIWCIKIKLQPELHVPSKGMRITVRSGSIQRCRRMIRGVWVLANHKARLRSWAGWWRGLVGTRLSSTNRVLFANQIAYFCSHIL